jgi:hypothetical protein
MTSIYCFNAVSLIIRATRSLLCAEANYLCVYHAMRSTWDLRANNCGKNVETQFQKKYHKQTTAYDNKRINNINANTLFVLYCAHMSAAQNGQNVLSHLPDAGISAGVSNNNVKDPVPPGQIRRYESRADSVSKSQSVYEVNGAIGAATSQANVPGEINNKNGQSLISFGSGSSNATAHGKELVETPYFKFKGTKWNWFSLINNIVLLIVLLELANPAGLFFNIGPDIFTHGYARLHRSCSHALIAAPSSFTCGCTFCTSFRIWPSTKLWETFWAT